MEGRSRRRGRQKDQLLEGGEDVDGISNPSMDSETEAAYQTFSQTEGESSAAEMAEEAAEAEHLVKDLKTRRRQRKKALSKLTSPKEDVAGELKSMRSTSRQRVEDTIREEEMATLSAEETTTAPIPPATEDGLATLPTDESILPTEEEIKATEASKVKEEAESIERAEASPSAEPPDTERSTKEEQPGTPRAAPTGAEAGSKPFGQSSMRARMKERLAKAKEEAEGEIEKEARKERDRQRSLRAQQPDSRYDAVTEAELERTTEEKQRQLRLRWEKRGQAPPSDKMTYMPTAEEAFDFFTRVWEPEPEEKKDEDKEEEEPKPSTSKTDADEEETEEGKEAKKDEDVEKGEDEKPLLDDADYDEEGYGPTAVRRANITPPDKLQEAEDKLLFIPPLIARPASEKVQEQLEPRFLEEEGFYVGVRPAVSARNKNKMENRLLREPDKGKQWFGEDGEMIVFPDPLRPTPSRPPMPEEVEPYLETVFKKAVMREFDSRYIDGVLDGSGRYQLDVDVNSIMFTHHHLFSREHVLATRLTELFTQYTQRRSKNMVNFLTDKLRALKSSSLHLQEYILGHKGEMSVVDRTNYEKRLQDYKFEIRQTRSVRDREEQMDRSLIKNIIRTWKELRSVREQQHCTNTPVKLQILKETVDKAQDETQWQMDLDDEVEEAREEHADNYARKMLICNEQMEKWEKQQAAKRDAEKKLKTGRRGSKASKASKGSKGSKGSKQGSRTDLQDELGEAEMERYQEILNEEDLPKPDAPEEFDENAARDQIKAKFMSIRRRPGEAKLYPELSNTMTVTPTSDCPRGEQNRREEVSRCKLFVKVLFNNKEVSRTGNRPLSQEFRVTFGQIYNLRIVQWPESIKFQIYETQGLSARFLAELYAAIPEASVTSQSVQLEEMEFSSDEKLEFGHDAVGSGVPFKFDATASILVTLMTSGTISTSVAWGVNEDGQPLVPPVSHSSVTNLFAAMKKMDPLAAIGATGVVNMEKLSKWFQESRLDPNDPANADLIYLLGSRSGESGPREFFRLEQLQEEFDLCSEADLAANRRFQMLSLRDREVAEFRTAKMVPPFEREIPRDAFAEYERKQREEDRQKQIDDLEGVRQAHSRYVQKIREQVIMRFRLASHQKRLEDMVVEEAVPNIAMLGISLMRLSEPRRPLKPLRKERKKVTAQAIKGDEVRILVNIIRATNIPIRKSQSLAAGGTTTRELDRKPTIRNIAGETMVHPYVEVMFQRNTVRTSAGDGPNPSFNEELELPLKAPNDDFSPNALQGVQDNIYLNLFDEVVVDIREDDRERETAVHQRLEKKWLGNIRIPFSTIYLNGKIDGTFRISTPAVLLGYTYDHTQGGGGDADMPMEQSEEITFLSLFITIEPPLIQPEAVKERFDTNEDEKLMQFAERWQEDLQSLHPRRHYKTSVIDVNGKNVFLTRYFKALKPPPEIEGKTNETQQNDFAARYVSLIPFVSDSVVFPGLCDIWSTCDQFLQMLAGDEEEHAVLLTNLFLGLGRKAYLLLGSAIPEGITAYVLTVESGEYYIWNSATGKRYSVHDNYCPLQSVGCLVNNENVWANVHQYEKPSQMDFNVNSTASWRPFFGRSNPSPGLGSIQPEALIYHSPNKNYVLDLQEKIEQMLKNKIMEWRSRYITRWNRHCTQIMRHLLPKLEENCGCAMEQQDLGELEESFRSYKVSGFPVNVPFVDLNTIVEAVFSTGVHSQETSDIEFALAVYVHGYSNNVLSIWIYVASLVRLR